ncbi:hypothetical protein ACTXPD_19355 [Vreelandella alkaliphila]|uniref:hypothetical protein n=1 Tax=Halomonadaceae TaxID=28256 RepID=UPI001D0032C1|nr:hypothetical protein [Halomonas sp. FME65]
MPRFKAYNYDQNAMVVINYHDQLQSGTFEHAVHYLIEHKLDLSVFHPQYRSDTTGRLAYDPAILFVYCKGITTSRGMQWWCETSIIFKALFCYAVPLSVKVDLQPSHVGSGVGIRQYWYDETTEPVQSAG